MEGSRTAESLFECKVVCKSFLTCILYILVSLGNELLARHAPTCVFILRSLDICLPHPENYVPGTSEGGSLLPVPPYSREVAFPEPPRTSCSCVVTKSGCNLNSMHVTGLSFSSLLKA